VFENLTDAQITDTLERLRFAYSFIKAYLIVSGVFFASAIGYTIYRFGYHRGYSKKEQEKLKQSTAQTVDESKNKPSLI